MAAFGGLLITNKGRALQAKAQTGVELHFNRIGVGDGNLGGQSIPTLLGLISPKMSLSLNKLKTQSGGKAIVGAVLSNQDVTTGFYFREIGVFAQDPDEGEILYCYGNAGSGAEYIPATGGPDVVNKQLDVFTLIANAANVTASVASGLYALAEDVGDMSTVPTTAKDAAGAITELFEALENADIPDATLTTKGKVQLSSATNSTAEDRAATPKAVKDAYDLAGAAGSVASSASTAVSTHAARTDNPHATTKAQVGLGSVDNYATANQAQAEAGAASNLFMTPLRTKQYTDKRLLNNIIWRINAGQPEWSVDGGTTWKGVGSDLSQYPNMMVGSIDMTTTLTDVVNISGKKGYLDRAMMYTNNASGNTAQIIITVDGQIIFDTNYAITSSAAIVAGVTSSGLDGMRFPGYATTMTGTVTTVVVSIPYSGALAAFCPLPNKLFFNNSVRIQVRKQSSPNAIACEYGIATE